MNPYFGTDFFGCIGLMFKRLCLFFIGLGGPLCSDELQVLVLFLAGITASLLGTFLVLKKTTMLANSLSHTVLLGIVTVVLFFGVQSIDEIQLGGLLLAAVVAGVLTSVATEFLIRVMRIQRDASIGLVFSAFFALGILLVTLFLRNSHIGVEAIMGNIDAVTTGDLSLVFYCAVGVSLFIGVFYRPLKVLTFDELFAKGIGIPTGVFRYLIMILTSAAAIASFRAVGVFLFLSLVVTPPLTMRLFTHSLKKILFGSILSSLVFAVVSVALSRHMLSVYMIPLSTSGLFVTLSGAVYLGGILFRNSGLKWMVKRGILPAHE